MFREFSKLALLHLFLGLHGWKLLKSLFPAVFGSLAAAVSRSVWMLGGCQTAVSHSGWELDGCKTLFPAVSGSLEAAKPLVLQWSGTPRTGVTTHLSGFWQLFWGCRGEDTGGGKLASRQLLGYLAAWLFSYSTTQLLINSST